MCVFVCVYVSSLIHTYIAIATYILIYISVGVGDLFCLPLGFAAIEFHWAAPCAVINLIWVICMTFGRVDPLAPLPLPQPPYLCHCLALLVFLSLFLSICPHSISCSARSLFAFCIVYHIVCFSEGRLTVSERGLTLMCSV